MWTETDSFHFYGWIEKSENCFIGRMKFEGGGCEENTGRLREELDTGEISACGQFTAVEMPLYADPVGPEREIELHVRADPEALDARLLPPTRLRPGSYSRLVERLHRKMNVFRRFEFDQREASIASGGEKIDDAPLSAKDSACMFLDEVRASLENQQVFAGFVDGGSAATGEKLVHRGRQTREFGLCGRRR